MDPTFFKRISSHILATLPLGLTALVILMIARYVFTFTMPFVPRKELKEHRNTAYGVVYAAYLASAALALVGTFFGSRLDPLPIAIGEMVAEGSMVIVLLRVSIWVNDQFILSRFSIVKEIGNDRNLGVGFCVAGSCLACGLILNGALTGFSADFALGLRDIVLYWILGQTVLVLASYGYQKTMRYDVHRLIEYDDNVAVGVSFGGFLTGLGIIIRAALVGSGQQSLGREVAVTVVLAIFGAILLLFFSTRTLSLLLPKSSYEDDVEMHSNVAIGAVAAASIISVALFIGSIIQR